MSPILYHALINSKWIKHLNIRPDIIKLTAENVGKKFINIGLGNEFVFRYDTKSINNKSKNQQMTWKLKNFCIEKNEKKTYRMVENFCKLYIR